MPETDYLLTLTQLQESLKWLLNKDLLQELINLQELLNKSYINKYKELAERSEHGCNCGFAVHAKELFLKLQEKAIAEKITYIYKVFIEEKR